MGAFKAFLVAGAASSAVAFVAPGQSRATVQVQAGKKDLEELCAKNPTALPFIAPDQGVSIWDPLGCADYDFWGIGNEATIGYLRHAEIKHGRVAMAGFLGFVAQSTPLVSGEHFIKPYPGYVAGVTPQEQWDNIPLIGKLQILVFVGMLESYGEGAGNPAGYVHYTKGGQPGYYPPIKGQGLGQIPLNLFDPFDILPSQSAAEKERGLFAEVNNGRLAMIGLFSLLAESATPGSNPQYKILAISIPEYKGALMTFDPTLYNPFIEQFGYVLGVCAILQQLALRRSK